MRGVEKIKTLGDAYMAVAGAPEARADHASAAIRLARGMLGAVDDVCRRLDVPLKLRIGLASGPVAGGVIGRQRILFDLWGDTVNTASRMRASQVLTLTRNPTGVWILVGIFYFALCYPASIAIDRLDRRLRERNHVT